MKVKEYLVNRILKLEEDLKQARNEYAGVSHCLELQKNKIETLNEKLEQYEIERKHIKEIITCNLTKDGDLYMPRLNCSDFDIGVLLAILDIKPEDYDNKEVIPDAENKD